MRRVVVVETQEEYDAWKAEQVPYFKQLKESGSIDYLKFPKAAMADTEAEGLVVSELKK